MLSPSTLYWLGIAAVSIIVTWYFATIWARYVVNAPFADPHAEPFGDVIEVPGADRKPFHGAGNRR